MITLQKKSVFVGLLISIALYASGCGEYTSVDDGNKPQQPNCLANQHAYNGECEPNDTQNCGSHGNACEPLQFCVNGECKNCPANQHEYGTSCEADDMQNCGSHGNACTSPQTCTNGSCQTPTSTQCDANQHAYSGSCEADDMKNCGSHGNACKPAQECVAGSCQARPCTFESTSSRSKAMCVDNRMLVCGSDSFYYYDTRNGNCTEEKPCVICPDGFGGCTEDSEAFCRGHQAASFSLNCIYSVYPPVCENNTGYICGSDNKYYTSAASRCSGTDICTRCDNGFLGCSSDPKAFCLARNSIPINEPDKCKYGHVRCDGKKRMECDGKSYAVLLTTCPEYCSDGINGENSECSEYMPTCTMKNGSKARIIGWNDGDTVVVEPVVEDDSCDPSTRYSIRVLHIDSPECDKSTNYNYGVQSCIESMNYSSTNDPYGYEAWERSTLMADKNTIVTISCDNPDEYNVCPNDDNGRPLAYVMTSPGQDVGTELTRSGLAIPSIHKISNPSEHVKQICSAFKEAVRNRLNLWSQCTTSDGQCVRDASAQLKSTKAGEYDYIYEYCQYVLGEGDQIQMPEKCEASSVVCKNNKLYTCSPYGAPSMIQNCTNGCNANGDACVTDIECTPGELSCTGSLLRYCTASKEMESIKTCTCNSSGTGCENCSGVSYCINSTHYYCQSNNKSMANEECTLGCSNSKCACLTQDDCTTSESPICHEGHCTSPVEVTCTKPAPAFCLDQKAYFCGDQGKYYLGKTCSFSESCVVCSDGYGGCASDPDAYCQNHGGLS